MPFSLLSFIQTGGRALETKRQRELEAQERARQREVQTLQRALLSGRLLDAGTARTTAATRARQLGVAAARIRQNPRYRHLWDLPDEDLVQAVQGAELRRISAAGAGRTGATDPRAADQRAVVQDASELYDTGEYGTWDEAYQEALRRFQVAGRLGGVTPPPPPPQTGGAGGLADVVAAARSKGIFDRPGPQAGGGAAYIESLRGGTPGAARPAQPAAAATGTPAGRSDFDRARARALELQAEGKSRAEITATLRREGFNVR